MIQTTLWHYCNNHNVDAIFAKWFEIIPHLERVYDLKLSVLACMSLIRLDLDQQTLASISNNLASMLKNYLMLYKH